MTDDLFEDAPRTQGLAWTIRQDIARPSPTVLRQIARFSTSQLSDGLNRFNAMDHAIKPVNPGMTVAGPAVTVKVRAADTLFLHKAAQLAIPGDVLVVDAGANCSNAILGDLFAAYCDSRGIAGIIVDGAARDVSALRTLGLPIFVRAIVPAGPDRDGPGHINIPISCGGVPVQPGDIVVGDDDGVVVVPSDIALQVCEAAMKKASLDEEELGKIRSGANPFEWVDRALSERGFLPAGQDG